MTVNWLQLSQQRSQLMKLIMAVHHLTDSLLEDIRKVNKSKWQNA